MEALDFTMSLDVKMGKLNRYELLYPKTIAKTIAIKVSKNVAINVAGNFAEKC